jgi:hypothetical protein
MTAPAFRYEPLDPENRSIRLLSLLPGLPDDPLAGRLRHSRLGAGPKYKALSYVWGASPASGGGSASLITVDGHGFPVSDNLLAALQHLRSIDGAQEALYWIDAVCINQGDVQERNHQVSLMRDIYAAAEQVVIWLGLADAESDAAFLAVNNWASTNDEKRKEGISLRVLRQNHSFFFSLDSRFTWLSRIWVLQEVAVSKQDPLLVCGSQSTPWSVFLQAWDILAMEAFEEMGLLFEATQSFKDEPASQETDLPRSDNRLRPSLKIDVINGLREAVQLRGGEKLFRLLIIARRSQSTDPRDRIYGLVGLLSAEETSEPGAHIPIDYRKPTAEVYADAMSHLLSRGDGLSFLAHCFLPGVGAPAPHIHSLPPMTAQPELPSWVPDFTRQVGGGGALVSSAAFQPPAGTGTGGASGAGANCVNGKRLDDSRTLAVEGLLVDVVEQVHTLGSSLKSCIELLPKLEDLALEARQKVFGDPRYGAEATAIVQALKSKDPVWKILVSNKALASGYDRAPESYGENHQLLLEAPVGDFKDINSLSGYERCLHEGVGKRCFFSTRGGFIGKCVPGVQGGDIVSILFGSTVPFILRPLQQTMPVSGVDRETHALVGAAYVGGIMEGQMVDELYCEDLMDSITFYLR